MLKNSHRHWVVQRLKNTCYHIKSKDGMSEKDARKYAKKYDNIFNVIPESSEKLKRTKVVVTFEVDISYHCKRDLDYALNWIKTAGKGRFVDICHQDSLYAENSSYIKITNGNKQKV